MLRRAAVLFLLLTSGCAGSVSVIPIGNDMGSPGARPKDDSGVHFFAPAPYVWISTAPAGKGGAAAEHATGARESDLIAAATGPAYTMEVVFLPDPSREYEIQWRSGLMGSITPKFTLDHGWNLVGFESTINTGLTASLALSGQAQVSRAIKVLPGEEFVPGLYKLRYDTTRKSWELGERVFP